MEFKCLVRSEHLNHNGVLFGGYMLLWVDEYAYIAAMEDYPCARFVTRAMEAANFTQGVSLGAILTFTVKRAHVGVSSVTYAVDVVAQDPASGRRYHVFQTSVTMCCVDETMHKCALP